MIQSEVYIVLHYLFQYFLPKLTDSSNLVKPMDLPSVWRPMGHMLTWILCQVEDIWTHVGMDLAQEHSGLSPHRTVHLRQKKSNTTVTQLG